MKKTLLSTLLLLFNLSALASYQSCMGEVAKKKEEVKKQETQCKQLQGKYPEELKKLKDRHQREKVAMVAKHNTELAALRKKYGK